MQDKVTFAERLREALVIRGITQTELCQITGINKSAMSQYCNGGLVPRQKKTHAIALALNVSEAWLMGYDVPMIREWENPLAEYRLGGMMDVLGEIGALNADGSVSDHAQGIVTSLIRNNAEMLKQLIEADTVKNLVDKKN